MPTYRTAHAMNDLSPTNRTVAPRDEIVSATFLEKYLHGRELTGRQNSDASMKAWQRAEQARECFKQLRPEAAEDSSISVLASRDAAAAVAIGLDAQTLVKELDCNRRLASKSKSAAAPLVYNEVLRKEAD